MDLLPIETLDIDSPKEEAGDEVGEFDEGEYYSIATHRCQTVSNWQERFCDVDFVQEITVNYGDGEVKPLANEELFKCSGAQCQICLDLNQDFFRVNVLTMFQSISDSAAAGCKTCELLERGITEWAAADVAGADENENKARSEHAEDEKNDEEEQQSDQEEQEEEKEQTPSPFLIVKIGLQEDGPTSVELFNPIESWDDFKLESPDSTLEFYTSRGYESSWAPFGFGREMSSTVSVEECVGFAKEQIQTCDTHHTCISSRVMKSPSRALDLGLEGEIVKLVEYNSSLGPYITLSHCWGHTTSMITTTSNNYQNRLHGIEELEFPKTFRDAVHITRGLGIRYLWIDSLCIIQDSLADWEVESSKMADVYAGTFLTIAATKSQNCDGGCLSDRMKSDDCPLETFTITGNSNGASFQVSIREALTIAHGDSFNSSPSLNTAPLFTRAWCFQERLLSPRLLHFHPDEMLWICRGSTVCECGYMQNLQLDPSLTLREEVRFLNQTFGTIDSQENEVDRAEVWRIWEIISKIYPQLSITKESDRLPAISGIAVRVSSVLPDSKYLAGIWSESIPIGLAWYTTPQASRQRQVEPGFPSWSWMSLNVSSLPIGLPPINLGEEFYNGRFTPDSRFQFLTFDATPATRNPFGPLKNGEITINGAGLWTEYRYDPSDFFFPCALRRIDDESEEEHPFYTDVKPDTSPGEITHGDKLLCLLLGAKGERIAEENRIGTDDGLQDIALVLKEKNEGIYQRVGLLVDYLRKKWFSGTVRIESVTIV